MTREQAIKAFAIAVHIPDVEYFNQTVVRVTPMINGFVALGILRFDEPISNDARATGKAAQVLADAGWDLSIFNILDRAGLKIVEK